MNLLECQESYRLWETRSVCGRNLLILGKQLRRWVGSWSSKKTGGRASETQLQNYEQGDASMASLGYFGLPFPLQIKGSLE